MTKTFKKIAATIMLVSAVMFAVPAMVTQPAFAADCDTSGGIASGAGCAKTDEQSTDLFGANGVFTTITNAALYLIGAISVLMLIYGGIRYTLSGGKSDEVTAAKNTILYAIIGIIVALLAYAIVNYVITTFVASGS